MCHLFGCPLFMEIECSYGHCPSQAAGPGSAEPDGRFRQWCAPKVCRVTRPPPRTCGYCPTPRECPDRVSGAACVASVQLLACVSPLASAFVRETRDRHVERGDNFSLRAFVLVVPVDDLAAYPDIWSHRLALRAERRIQRVNRFPVRFRAKEIALLLRNHI